MQNAINFAKNDEMMDLKVNAPEQSSYFPLPWIKSVFRLLFQYSDCQILNFYRVYNDINIRISDIITVRIKDRCLMGSGSDLYILRIIERGEAGAGRF